MTKVKNIITILLSMILTLFMVIFIKQYIIHRSSIINCCLIIFIILIFLLNIVYSIKAKEYIFKILHIISIIIMFMPLVITFGIIFINIVMFPTKELDEYKFPNTKSERFVSFLDLDGQQSCLLYKKNIFIGFECESVIVCTYKKDYKFNYKKIYDKYFKDKNYKYCHTDLEIDFKKNIYND